MATSKLGLALLAVSLAAGTAEAVPQTATSNMAVSATVSSSCTIVASGLTFAAYDPTSGSVADGQTAIAVSCTKGTVAKLTLGQGSHASGTSTDAAPDRRLQDSGSNVLQYGLFSDTGRSTVWGNTAGTGVAYTSTTSASTNVQVFGRIHAGQDVPAGTYTDTVVATITF